MKRTGRTNAGFTLIELLVVIGIIAVLVALLIPTIAAATLTARRTMTKATLNDLSLSLKAFKADFSDYPPSRPRMPLTGPKTDPASGELATGAANLTYYLRGPGGSGWGMGGGGVMPFPGQKPSRSFGPYAQTIQDRISWQTVGTQTQPLGFLDSFWPAGIILYFKYNETGGDVVTDNGPGDPAAKTNYMDQTKFNEIAQVPSGASFHWVTQDFLLMSPGPDGRYGYVRVNKQTGVVAPCSSGEPDTAQEYYAPYCDDVFSWN